MFVCLVYTTFTMADGERTWQQVCVQTRPQRSPENVNGARMRALGQILLLGEDNIVNYRQYRLVYSTSEMPTHCCDPECTKKGHREEDASKVSYFQFPNENIKKKKRN